MRIKITIQGTSPLIMHKWTLTPWVDGLSPEDRAKLSPEDEAEDEAKRYLYTKERSAVDRLAAIGRGETDPGLRTIIMPAPNLLMCITDGSRLFFKNGRSKVTTQKFTMRKASLTPGCVSLNNTVFKSEGGWSVHTRGL